jgi:hypothetical protein
MDLSNVTIQYCVDRFEEGESVVLNDGHVICFIEE